VFELPTTKIWGLVGMQLIRLGHQTLIDAKDQEWFGLEGL
jgi:hypothetical protein